LSFEIKEKDLLGRIGKLKTKSGTVETPLLFPVINPSIQPIPPQKLKDTFGFQAVITNSYIIKKRYDNKPVELGLHKFLGYDGAIMTDSGAYQILVYGDIDVSKEIVAYQKASAATSPRSLTSPQAGKSPKNKQKSPLQKPCEEQKRFLGKKPATTSYGLDPCRAENTWI
jgi:7-cyano-7-deazaguanine tRNA-ribosyltransferase